MVFKLRLIRRYLLNAATYRHVVTIKDRLNDNPETTATAFVHLKALDPDLPDYVWGVIIRYRPHLSNVQWKAVREFTIANAVRMKPRTYQTVRRLMCMSGRFNAWVWAVTGTEPTLDRVYTQNNVYRYLQECMPKHSEVHRWGVVRQLGVIAETLASTTVQRMPAPHFLDRRPFALSEIATLHSWAATLTTTLKRRNAWAILGLAGGAGLRAGEVINVRLKDVQVIDGRLFVDVSGKRARRVPVMYPWTRTLLRSIEGRTNPDDYVFHGFRYDEYQPRSIQTFLTDHPGLVRATLSRLRSTWITTHINNGLPLPELMAIAGLAATNGLNKHLAQARPANISAFLGLITGEELAR